MAHKAMRADRVPLFPKVINNTQQKNKRLLHQSTARVAGMIQKRAAVHVISEQQ